MNAADRINDGASTVAAETVEIMQVDDEIASVLTPDCTGLYMTNTRNDFKFYHGFGQASPTVKEVRDEYQRLAPHPLPTLVSKVKKLCDSVPDQRCLILITTINAQSLVTHSEDISSDSIINRSDYSAISEIWMDYSMPVNVLGFDLIL
ncbi:hypothetical protein TNCV_5125981 [Trichonephila clavipes]|nr:hypothetical protein TNCV_5125981 [Trichonephila clavipes]